MEPPDLPLSAAELESRPTLVLVYTVHLDTQWRWTVQDTIRDFIPATLEGNFELFAEHSERVLSFEGAFRYQLIEEYYPDAFERLQQLVASGNWCPAGTMLDSPDVNCVAPESLLRHILYAKRYFQSRLGTTSVDLFLPDCFGFGHALPTIAAHCGLAGFSAQKFGNWGAPAKLPFHLGRWLGPDGEGVVAALRPEGYGEGLHEDLSHAERWQRRIERQFEASGLRVAFMYVGLGDRGGSLDADSLDWIEKSVAGDGPTHVVQTASDTLFRALTPEQIARLPRHQGELLLPSHGTGCWTSQAAAKRWNRACEQRGDQAERAAVLADWLGIMTYPAAMIRQAWQRFLWHQMHDDLTGTSIPEAYRFTWNDQLISLNQFETVLDDAIGAVGSCLDTRGPGRPVLVFNPHARRRCDLVELELEWPDAPEHMVARGPEDELVPVQIVDRHGADLRVVFAPPLPPLGLFVWHLEPGTAPHASALEATARGLANDLYRLELNAAGEIASLVDRRSGTELLAAPLRLELLPDRSRRWPAWEILQRDIGATPTPLGDDATIALVESGPVRAVLEVSRRHAGSTYRQRITLAAGDAGHRIEIDLDVDWRSRGRLLKAALRQRTTTPEAIYGLGCGTVRRGVNSPAKYEVPGLWAAPRSGGLALIAEGQSGWDRPDEGTLRLSLLRSPGVGRRFRHQGSQDHGRHHLRFALTSHEDPATTDEHAWRFANRPLARSVRSHPGARGRGVSLLEVERGALVRALKKPEEGAGIVLRLQETGGRRRNPLRVTTPTTVRRVTRLDGSEQALEPVEPTGSGVELDLGAYALRTLRLELTPPAASPPRPRHEPLALPYDIRATSAPGEAGVLFGTDGYSLPAELWPAAIQVGAVPFTLGPATARNALACAGQELRWQADATRLYLLAASIDHRRTAVLELGQREVRLEVDRWDGIIGRWKGWRRGLRQRQWALPGGGFLRDDRIAWVATHRHDATGSDEPYEYGYLFRYRLDLEPGERALALPATPEIVLFAATLA